VCASSDTTAGVRRRRPHPCLLTALIASHHCVGALLACWRRRPLTARIANTYMLMSVCLCVCAGTTYSCVAAWDHATGRPIVLPAATGEKTVPSYVAYTAQARVVGQVRPRALFEWFDVCTCSHNLTSTYARVMPSIILMRLSLYPNVAPAPLHRGDAATFSPLTSAIVTLLLP
jgi:Hsp70 protein